MSFKLYKLKFDKNVSVQKPEVTFATSHVSCQSFRYPSPLIDYLKKYPTTPKLHIKLLKSCKYFYSKKDLFIPLNTFDLLEIKKIISAKKEPLKYKIPFNIWFTGCLSVN